jgi:hypothetical protein
MGLPRGTKANSLAQVCSAQSATTVTTPRGEVIRHNEWADPSSYHHDIAMRLAARLRLPGKVMGGRAVLYVWLGGVVLGLVAGGAVLTDLPLAVKLLIGLAVVIVGVLGKPGSVLIAGLLLAAGLLTFVALLLTAQPGAVGSSLGVATLLIASGAAFSIRELFRDRQNRMGSDPAVGVERNE